MESGCQVGSEEDLKHFFSNQDWHLIGVAGNCCHQRFVHQAMSLISRPCFSCNNHCNTNSIGKQRSRLDMPLELTFAANQSALKTNQ